MSGTKERELSHKGVESKDLQTFRELTSVCGIPAESAHPALMGLTVESSGRFSAQIMEGLPYSVFDHLQENTGLTRRELSSLGGITARTLARRKESGRLETGESDRTARLSRVFAEALDLFEYDADAAREWMSRERRALGGETPWRMARTEPGAREVETLIGRLEHGVFG
jgi:putative toxin-antitoxin system antitoxin component (TIGR02293 family)